MKGMLHRWYNDSFFRAFILCGWKPFAMSTCELKEYKRRNYGVRKSFYEYEFCGKRKES